MDFIKNNVLIGNDNNVWIGGEEKDGKWSWSDGSKFDWDNWEPPQPTAPQWDDSISECAYLWRAQSYRWADAKCEKRWEFPFICKS